MTPKRAASSTTGSGVSSECVGPSEQDLMSAFEALEVRLDRGERVSAYDLRALLNTVASVNKEGGEPSPGAGEAFLRETLRFRRVAAVEADAGRNISVLTWENQNTRPTGPDSLKHRWRKVIF